jgi:hypothetical protein
MFKTGVLIMALSTTLFGNWFTNLFDPTPTPTIKIPVDLSKVGTIVDMEFRVNYDESTYFALRFSCTDVKLDGGLDCKKKRKFMGINGYLYGEGKQTTIGNYKRAKREFGNMIDEHYDLDGTIVPLYITLHKLEDNGTELSILDKSYDTKGQNAKRGSRDITVKHLNKGKYTLKVKNLEAFIELKDRPIEFIIRSTYRK